MTAACDLINLQLTQASALTILDSNSRSARIRLRVYDAQLHASRLQGSDFEVVTLQIAAPRHAIRVRGPAFYF